jgi:putative transposase
LAHATGECKYHVVWIPRYRLKALSGELRKHFGPVLRELARRREGAVEEGHLQLDHVHMLLSIPPKYAGSQVLGFLKGKRAIHIARTSLGRRQNCTGQHFWARGYYGSTVGRDEAAIREYIRRQEAGKHRLDRLNTFDK